jgi:predicted Zn-dependent protease
MDDDFTMMMKETAITSEKNIAPEAASQPAFHPNILLARWEIAVRAKDWSAASGIAKAVMAALPSEPLGWIYHGFAQHQLGQSQEARQTLLAAARKFPNDWRIAFNIACYTAQLGDAAGAWNWLDRAMELGDGAALKQLAVADPNLKPLWEKSQSRIVSLSA